MPLRKVHGDELISQSGEEVDSLLDNINEPAIGNTKTRKTRYSSNKLNVTTSQSNNVLKLKVLSNQPENIKQLDKTIRIKDLSGVYKQRTQREANKPRLVETLNRPNLIIPRGFESKQSFHSRFKILENLGEGGSSIVRKVVCKEDGKICAVKSCKSNDQTSMNYIKKEHKILKTLSHPNIIKTYGIFESTSNVCISNYRLIQS